MNIMNSKIMIIGIILSSIPKLLIPLSRFTILVASPTLVNAVPKLFKIFSENTLMKMNAVIVPRTKNNCSTLLFLFMIYFILLL